LAARAVASLDRRGRIALLTLEDPASEQLVTPLPAGERLASWHLAWPGGRLSSRGAAGIDLLRALGYPRAASAASYVAEPVERLYSLVAEHREALGRFAPDVAAPRRYP
jgi:predicted DCC family thiol-disulfide oxidoreductase YuxK